ncbi:MAG TPA: PilZ domain-containing protein, partial [Acinetobacter radioresistens]|nr:PilZ domain-containing protein [Acinetobacter radioresistens]
METLQHQGASNERRVMSRIDAALRINYQLLYDDVAL